MSRIIKLTTMVLFLLIVCQIDGFAANRLLYENFDDKVLDSRLQVIGHDWAILSPPQYNMNAAGRNGTGYSFTSGSINEAYLHWRNQIPNPWPTDEMYVSFWMRYPTFRQTDSHENIKLFYPHWDNAQGYVHYSMSSNNSVYYSAMANGSMVTAGRWLTCPNQADGKWHRYEFYVKFSAGISKFWYDGSLIVNDNFGTGKWTRAMRYISTPSIDAEEAGSFSRQVDDLEIWDGTPGSTGTVTPPPSGGTTSDTTAPAFSGMSPAVGVASAPVDTNISFNIKDSGSGVDKSSIEVTINGTKVTPTISGTAADYTMFYNPPSNFAYGARVQVGASAKDLKGNSTGTQSYTFTITTSSGSKTTLQSPSALSIRIM